MSTLEQHLNERFIELSEQAIKELIAEAFKNRLLDVATADIEFATRVEENLGGATRKEIRARIRCDMDLEARRRGTNPT